MSAALKLAAVAIVGLLPVAASEGAPPREGGFAAAAPIAGSRHEVMMSHDVTMTLICSMDGTEQHRKDLSRHSTLACSVLVAGSEATAPSAARLDFGDCHAMNAKEFVAAKARPTRYSGKCYAVKRDDTGFVVSGEGVLSDDEKHATDMLVAHLLGTAPLAPLLAGKPLKKGDTVAVPIDVAEKCFGLMGWGAKVESLTLVLAEEPVAGSTVVFKATAKLAIAASDDLPLVMTIEPAGTWNVARSTCRIAAITMQGPVKVRGTIGQGGVKLDMNADGDCTLAWSVASH